uniref:Obscurin, cytoskeletal calmodulin and titin-interacting RhoGEF b n=1 Tax=Hucho hucho TaxID=62062 RepID=A0A4W5RQW9_9TELE
MDQNLFGGAPRFLTRPKAFAVCVGKDATLSCTIVGNPIPLITWEKEKLRLTSGGRFKMVDDGDVYCLTIYDLTLEDSGQYMCRAKNNVGEAYACVTLHVGLPHEMVERAPVFMVKPTSARVGLGGDVVFHCRVAAYPEPKFDWEKDGRYLAETNRIKVTSDSDSSSLRIQSVRSLDSGTYTCRAHNSVGHGLSLLGLDHSSTALVSHLPKGVFTRTCTVTEGKHAKLSCFVTGHPKPHIIWRKDGGNIGEGRRQIMYEDQAENFILKILYCKQRDNGLYTCNASNMAGHTYSAVLVIVKEPKVPFRRKLQDVEVQEKMTATLLCEVPVSATQASWFMEETRLEDCSKYRMEEEGTMRRLTIHNVTTNDDAVYICEMKEGSRTVAELTVLGNITKKLPRRTVVPVSDTVIFCVELEHPCSEAYWTRNGELTICSIHLQIHHITEFSQDLSYIHEPFQTIPPSLPAARKHPPDPPIDVVVRNKTDSSITLHWSPPDSDRPVPIKGYMVERRKVGAQTWQRCNGMEISPFTEITIQNFTEEASYQFRISAVNNYGQSQYLEVPGTFYLEPSAEVKTGLMNSTAISGEEASLSVDLSAVCSGFWSINGRLLRSGGDYLITRQKTTHTLMIRTVLMEMNGAVVKFVGVQQAAFTNKDSVQKEVRATLSQKATLSCEVSDTKTEVKWYKDGKQIIASKTVSMETKGKSRLLVVDKMEKRDAGEYTCEAGVAGVVDSVQKEVKATLSQKATLSCEVSDTKTEVKWYKDGKLLTSSKTVSMETKGKTRQLVIENVEKKDAGQYTCEVGAEKLVYEIQDSVQREVKATLSQKATLSCEVSDTKTEVKWYKDGKLLTSSKTVSMETKGKTRQLVIEKVEKKDAGQYTCEVGAEKLVFKIQVTGMEDILDLLSEVRATLSQKATLSCEVSDTKTEVKWYKDGKLLTSSKTVSMETKGKTRQLVIEKVEKKDAGEVTCEVGAEKLVFKIQVTGFSFPSYPSIVPPSEMKAAFSNKDSVQNEVRATLSQKANLSCELLDTKTEVKWYRDGKLLTTSKTVHMLSMGKARQLVIENVEKRDTREYTCEERYVIMLSFFIVLQMSELSVSLFVALSWSVSYCFLCPLCLLCVRDGIWFGCWDCLTLNVMFLVLPCTSIIVPSETQAAFTNKDSVQKEVRVTLSQKATLSCEVSDTKTEVKWYKDGKLLTSSKTVSVETKGKTRQLVIEKVEKKDAGQCYTVVCYDCFVSVEAAFTNKDSVQNEVRATLSQKATLSCEVSDTKTEVKWYKDGKLLTSSKTVSMETKGKTRQLVIEKVEKKDAGQYTCEVGAEKLVFKIQVTGMEDMKAGCLLMFLLRLCRLNGPKQDVLLYTQADVSCLSSVEMCFLFVLCSILNEGILILLWHVIISPSEIQAAFTNKDSVQKEVRVTLSQKATLSCDVSDTKMEVKWYKDGKLLTSSKTVSMETKGKTRQLVIEKVEKKDAGQYTCEVGAENLAFKIQVTGMMSLTLSTVFVVSSTITTMLTSLIFVSRILSSEKIVLTTELTSESASVKWFRDGEELKEGTKYEIKREGHSRTLIVKSTEVKDSGTYSCHTDDDKLEFKVQVKR